MKETELNINLGNTNMTTKQKPKGITYKIYIVDLLLSLWTWLSIWFTHVVTLERRKLFVDKSLSDKYKKSLPAKIWYLAYKVRGIS